MTRAAFGILGAVSVLFGLLCIVNSLSLLDSIVASGGDKETWAVFLGCVILFLGSLCVSALFFRRASARKN